MVTYVMKNMSVGLSIDPKKMTLKEQGQFLIRASDMLNNGFTLLEVLQFLSRIHGNKNDIMTLMEDLQKGEPIHKGFINAHFDQQVCAQIYFAERHGFLSKTFRESGSYLLKKDEQRKKFFKLMQYPLILLFVLFTVAIMINTLLLPRFQLLYSSMGYEPHTSIKLFFSLIENMPAYLIIIFLIIIGCLLVIRLYFRNKTALEVASFYSSIPFFRTFYKLYQTIFLSREWSYLLKSGFSMNDIITMMETQSVNQLLQETAKELKRKLLVGHTFSASLLNLPFVNEELFLIVTHGEKNGRLDYELFYYSNFCLQQLEEKIVRLFVFIQPMIFIMIGLMVLAIYMSIFFPMFQMMDSI